jgi:UDP-N-acetylmuramate dehydrogenase
MRQEKHPLEYPNAGSIFKNSPGVPAGRLIEEMGLKGKLCGDAEVSPRHANFIVNKGKATAADILALIGVIQDKAREEKGIDLETEVIIIGEN